MFSKCVLSIATILSVVLPIACDPDYSPIPIPDDLSLLNIENWSVWFLSSKFNRPKIGGIRLCSPSNYCEHACGSSSVVVGVDDDSYNEIVFLTEIKNVGMLVLWYEFELISDSELAYKSTLTKVREVTIDNFSVALELTDDDYSHAMQSFSVLYISDCNNLAILVDDQFNIIVFLSNEAYINAAYADFRDVITNVLAERGICTHDLIEIELHPIYSINQHF